jgi:hypothetical protein
MKKIIVKPILTENQIKKKEGHFFPESHFTKIMKESCDVYIYPKKLLFKFRKGVIPDKISCHAYKALEKEAKKKHPNRGSASGLLNIKTLPKYVGKLTKKSKFRTYYNSPTGESKKDHISNMVSSGIIGYYDKPDRNAYRKKLSKKELEKVPKCRTTKFTKEEVEKWHESLPLIEKSNQLFKKLVPGRHKLQLKRASQLPKFQINKTAFSTITINYNYRTATHKDKGDLPEGFGNLIVLEKSKCLDGDDYEGNYLGYPQYGIAVDLRQGDFIAMDVHEWHTNTPIKPKIKGKTNYGRLSIVSYLRKNMIHCLK